MEGSQDRPLAFSPEGIALKAESGVLHSQSRMTAEEESRETKQKQHEGRHGDRFSTPIVMKVKPLRVGGLLANHRPAGADIPGDTPRARAKGPCDFLPSPSAST